jgi:hypothetical protein
MSRHSQGTTLFTALLALVGLSVVVQLWLLASSVDAVLRHDAATPMHAAIVSAVLFLLNGALILYVFAFDRRVRASEH